MNSRDPSKSSRPSISTIFWKNLIFLVFLTQEIVLFTYEDFETDVLVDIPGMKVACNLIKNENNIPASKIFYIF